MGSEELVSPSVLLQYLFTFADICTSRRTHCCIHVSFANVVGAFGTVDSLLAAARTGRK